MSKKNIITSNPNNEISNRIKYLSNLNNVSYDDLWPEYVDTGSEKDAVREAIKKKYMIAAVRAYIQTSSLENIDSIFHNILDNTLVLDDYENDFLNIVEKSDENEVITFSKFNLIAILKLNDLNKPLIRGEEKEFVDEIINKIVHSDDFIIEMTKEDALKLYNIIMNYKLSFESLSEINNYYLLCDDRYKIVYQSTNDDIVLSKSKDKK